ncbi:IS110 family RNA-guided transposase [Leeuwenhoekiella blandensis]|uniref:IS110 family transposase n=1 Tax=Leeuwenhoekiella blandensis (strain CECT 7118 / CCUG 51940 / KCTC 22103 / MED217) TaxID=398720 RepID=A3XNP7_LEEBM|nr:IS110 family transposase [Leeuwenhoekiella blandensis]EAQ48826.1 IS110 family transposase [Leeuwenhoekiella blandensis MED217]
MSKYSETYGVDISKDVFDVANTTGFYRQYPNTVAGFKKFIKELEKSAIVVMEATGYYHYCLAQFLFESGQPVSVVNPLSVKRFIQMRLSKVKTDKSDAKAICDYALINPVPLYTGKDQNQAESLQLLRYRAVLKQRTQLKNKIHGEQALGIPSKAVFRSLNRSKKILDKEIKSLETRLLSLVKAEHQQQLTNLKSIPGLGDKTAALLIVLTDGFTKFETASQLCSFAGTTPTIRQSGSSVRGKSRISKMGNQKLRNLLFLCAFSASKYNTACRKIYERIIAKGKSKKLALIAVINKLIKQAFAIAKSGLPYDPNYATKLN